MSDDYSKINESIGDFRLVSNISYVPHALIEFIVDKKNPLIQRFWLLIRYFSCFRSCAELLEIKHEIAMEIAMAHLIEALDEWEAIGSIREGEADVWTIFENTIKEFEEFCDKRPSLKRERNYLECVKKYVLTERID